MVTPGIAGKVATAGFGVPPEAEALVNAAPIGPVRVIVAGVGMLDVNVTVQVAEPAAVAVGAVVTTQVFVVPAGTCASTTPANWVTLSAAATTASTPNRPSLMDGFNFPSCDADA
jgi:hypothetical protein